jgi:hypothetical protein
MKTAASMRIVVWNYKMAFSRKWQFLEILSPDIAVIPECSKSSIDVATNRGFDGRWFCDKPQKGLGVLIAKPCHGVSSRVSWRLPYDLLEPRMECFRVSDDTPGMRPRANSPHGKIA